MDDMNVTKIDQQTRITDLYFGLNQFASAMRMHINYKQLADMRAVYPNFQYCMIELYYLVRFRDIIKSDHVFTKKFDDWIEIDLSRGIPVKLCKYSLGLFGELVGKLVQMGIVEK